MRRALSLGVGAVVLMVACEAKPPLSPGSGLGQVNARDQISALWDTSDTAIVSSPEVQSGYQFTVSFKTVQGACLAPDYIGVQGSGASVTVTPFDLNTYRPGTMCPMSLTSAVRNTQVVLTTIGLDTIRVVGRGGITLTKIIKVIP